MRMYVFEYSPRSAYAPLCVRIHCTINYIAPPPFGAWGSIRIQSTMTVYEISERTKSPWGVGLFTIVWADVIVVPHSPPIRAQFFPKIESNGGQWTERVHYHGYILYQICIPRGMTVFDPYTLGYDRVRPFDSSGVWPYLTPPTQYVCDITYNL